VPKVRVALLLAAAGALVGLVVATASVITGASLCEAGGTGLDCYRLTRTLAVRTGLVAGVVTVVMGLLVAGLAKMLSENEKERAERAMEAYLASREPPSEEPP
jgi:ABC-type proline/glycine betaine transport system permease subunit